MTLPLAGCGGTTPTSPSAPAARAGVAEAPGPTPLAPVPQPIQAFSENVLLAAGDIALCPGSGSDATARLLDRLPGLIAELGDAVYPYGTSEQFATCYDRSWGRHKARTMPTPGNHEWDVGEGAPYFGYFGSAAGPAGRGYYSYTLGTWLVLSLNSNIAADAGSPQYEWARAEIASHPTACAVAYWHHPLFSSSRHGNIARMQDMWRLLDRLGVDVVLAAHDHDYERFAPQDADQFPDPRGIRAFVVGTGGAALYGAVAVQPNSERRAEAWGVLRLTLRSGAYDWDFVPVDGQDVRDAGSAPCTD